MATLLTPLSLHHRILRALAQAELPFTRLRDTVAGDGHPNSREITFCITALAELIGDGLVLKDGLHYGISVIGTGQLLALEACVRKAMVGGNGVEPSGPPIFKAALIDPHAASGRHGRNLLTRSIARQTMSHTERSPAALRPGSQDALACPSRIGNHLHHRDGRVTDLQGKTQRQAT